MKGQKKYPMNGLDDRLCIIEERLERLEGVKGPERRLVGESRSDEPQVGVEERKERSDCSEEGRRVAEIVELAELLRQFSGIKDEARRALDVAGKQNDQDQRTYELGFIDGLAAARIAAKRMAEKRSDLCNAELMDRPESATSNPNQTS